MTFEIGQWVYDRLARDDPLWFNRGGGSEKTFTVSERTPALTIGSEWMDGISSWSWSHWELGDVLEIRIRMEIA